MANSPSEVDFTVPLATKLATAVSDGTWAAIFNVLKVDKIGKLVPASLIYTAGGQLLSNLVDDFIQKVWALNEGLENYNLGTVGAVTDDAIVATLADGDLVHILVDVQGHGVANNEVCSESINAHYYRDGTITELGKISYVSAQANLAGFAIDLVISSNDIKVEVTGVAAKTINWDARVTFVRRTRA